MIISSVLGCVTWDGDIGLLHLLVLITMGQIVGGVYLLGQAGAVQSHASPSAVTQKFTVINCNYMISTRKFSG